MKKTDTDRVPPPDWVLERVAFDELPAGRSRAAARDPATADRLRCLADEDRAFFEAHPPERVVPEIRRRLRTAGGTRPRGVRLPALLGFGAPAMAMALLLVWIGTPMTVEDLGAPPPLAGQRDKGDLTPQLLLFRRSNDGRVEALPPDGADALAGDLVQLSYVAHGRPHGVIVSIDGRGRVTLHLPQSEDGPTELAQSGATALPDSYELDEAPDFERFVLVTSWQPIDTAAVLKAARRVASTPDAARNRPLPLAFRAEQASFQVNKIAADASVEEEP